MKCKCGNTPEKDGFFPCDEQGNEIEPLPEIWWNDLYVCARCKTIYKGANEMKKGDYVKTPRFLTVKIAEVFENMETAREQGYKETTHYWDDENYEILGKHTGTNTMIFGAIKKERMK